MAQGCGIAPWMLKQVQHDDSNSCYHALGSKLPSSAALP
jgi:hypothetical protein